MLTAIDPVSATAFAVALPSKHARHSAQVAQALVQGLAADTSRKRLFLSDNGSEFKGAFDQTLARLGLTHYWTYPKRPKMNAHAERFGRTVQEQFIDWHEELLFTDLALFNQKLADWLVAYNTLIPHHRLGLLPPNTMAPHPSPRVPKVLDEYTMLLCAPLDRTMARALDALQDFAFVQARSAVP